MSDLSSPTTPPAPRWPLVVVVVALLPLALAGSLILSAAATLLLAEHAAVPLAVRPALVAMVEVVSTAGTLLAIFSTGRDLRVRGMVAVVAASSVALVAGAQAYGLVGMLAPLFVVGLVHLAAESWAELRTTATTPVTVPDHPLTSADDTEPPVSEEAVKAPEPVPDQPATVELGPVHGPLTLVETLRPAVEAAVEAGTEIGERSIARDLGVSRHAVRTAKIEIESGLSAVSA